MNLRVAPFVGVRVSTSGIRASVGPRAARVHAGSGKTSISSGFGPFTASAAIGRPPARGSSKSAGRAKAARPKKSPPSTADSFLGALELAAGVAEIVGSVMNSRQAAKVAANSEFAALMLTTLHLHDFPPVHKPIAPELQPIPRKWSNLWIIDEQAVAKNAADYAARCEAYQRDVAKWDLLQSHDPMEVIATVDKALADNVSQSACVDAGTGECGNYVTLVVHYPGIEVADGLVKKYGTLVRRPEKDKIELYRHAVASTVVASAKEALACAPAAAEAYVVVLRYDLGGRRAKGVSTLDAIYAGALDRSVLTVDWASNQPFEVISSARAVRMKQDRKGALQPLGKAAGEDLRSLVETVVDQTRTDAAF